MAHLNGGVNGNAVGLPNMLPALPTPAGHQQDLNVINNMLSEYTKLMDENRHITERLVEGVGRVRQRAKEKDMSNEELLTSVANEVNDTTRNLELEISQLQKSLHEIQEEAKEYTEIAFTYAKSLSSWLEQIHAFKLKAAQDTALWHKSYRDQLAIEREENLNLRLQLVDCHAAAARAQGFLRQFQEKWNGSDVYYDQVQETKKYRQLARMWKRMALKEVEGNEDMFSDDDDVIDSEEKKRIEQRDLELEKGTADSEDGRELAGSLIDAGLEMHMAEGRYGDRL